MPNHFHAVIAFCNTGRSINSIVGNGKRFMAYELMKRLRQRGHRNIIEQMKEWVNATDKRRDKQHEVFEPSFDWKHCRSDRFIEQKLKYLHWNPCKTTPPLAAVPEEYKHSSACYYLTGKQGVYPVMNYMELRDIDLAAPR